MVGKNNPFNIRYSCFNHWLGLDDLNPQTNGFCNFVDLKYGIRAACCLLMVSYRKKGVLSVSEIISRFAPSNENDTDRYITFVCGKLHIFPFDIPETIYQFSLLLHAMSIYEGNPIPSLDIFHVVKLFNLKLSSYEED